LGGITVLQLKNYPELEYLGITALIFSAIFFIIGIYRFTLLKKSLKRLYDISDIKDDKK
jgi:putative membrane protein